MVILVVAMVWLVGSLCVLRAPRGAGPSLAISAVTNSTSQSPRETTFRLRNERAHSIFLSDLAVEVKTATGWQTSSHIVPKDPRNVEGGTSKELVVNVPAETGTWRLRVVYGDEVRYPLLLVLKTELAISSRSLGPFSRLRPGDTWMGSNSLLSAEISN